MMKRIISGGDGPYYLHVDQDILWMLRSLSLMTDSSGALVADSMARFLPFGAYRSDGSEPVDGNDLSDRGFTGHYENREIGLTYMQARYTMPQSCAASSARTPSCPIRRRRLATIDSPMLIKILSVLSIPRVITASVSREAHRMRFN
jgi:hypothetical protein